MDSITRVLLDRVQRSFPVVARPFDALSEGLGVSEEEVRARLEVLKRQKVIRQISAIFNTGALGYRSSLVAMAVPEEQIDRAAEAVNRYPGVSHNYLRPGSYNMWFTVAAPPGAELAEVVRDLAAAAGGWPVLILPAVRKYKLEVVLDVLEDGDPEGAEEDRRGAVRLDVSGLFKPTSGNIRIAKCVQEDLPLAEKPFDLWASSLDMDTDTLIRTISDWIGEGAIRRFAAVLNHRNVGFRANGMVVWSCPEDQADRYGEILASYAEVSHCYHRPPYPQWPYNLYAMVHGRSPQECEATAQKLGRAIGLEDFRILFSTREFKKIRLKLFWD